MKRRSGVLCFLGRKGEGCIMTTPSNSWWISNGWLPFSPKMEQHRICRHAGGAKTWVHLHQSRPHHFSNNPSFRQKHPVVTDGSDGSDGTWYRLIEDYMLPVALHAYLLDFATGIWSGICTIRTTLVSHSSQGLESYCNHFQNAWRFFCLSSAESNILRLRYFYILGATLSPYMFSFEMLSLIAIQSSLSIHPLSLHLPCHYHILEVWNILSNLHTL